MQNKRRKILSALLVLAAVATQGLVQAQTPSAMTPKLSGVLFENVRVFNGTADKLSAPANVLVMGNVVKTISSAPISVPAGAEVSRVQGEGRTLMPGLIDAHTHIMFATVPQLVILTSDVGFVNVAAVKAANDTLMRGFTTIRDLGGPVFGLKRGIDMGLVNGPRIFPSGAFISQTGGHGDFRLPNELPVRPGEYSFSERVGAAVIADNADTVRQRSRELLALGASQLKLMAGGGVSSNYDPLDVTQYTVPELRAAVEAAENWGTYVTVHAYTPRAVRQAIEAGVRCIDHGQLLDDATAKLMAEKGIWWSLQPFVDDHPSPFPEGSANRLKQLEMFSGTDTAYALARKYKIKTAWGTDTLFDAAVAATQGEQLAKMTRWFSPVEVLKMGTSVNAELLALAGARSPYRGRLGVVAEGALADLLLVDGNPLENIQLIANPAKNFLVIMKDGKVYKNALPS
ncbi:imidazolonepropionase-like amidohydrolase [Paucibacter oligotrophus]|uniref:Imidazolonepropionase-like amidohydrolase n=1 Tax=Roseateles oligotrophus TaxID=1769250 RepID=A0A840L295_9BURK|nr:amidohydrolase family protein [Roseateles oligotrophus]MBB4842370.1 imidazolonepropionase-like amidohydrolase [Roseateles oligotrophus]